MTRQKLQKQAMNALYARRFPSRSRKDRKATRHARIVDREARWIARYDAIEHAAGHRGINEPPEAPKNSRIGTDVRRRRRRRRGRPGSSRPAALTV